MASCWPARTRMRAASLREHGGEGAAEGEDPVAAGEQRGVGAAEGDAGAADREGRGAVEVGDADADGVAAEVQGDDLAKGLVVEVGGGGAPEVRRLGSGGPAGSPRVRGGGGD